MRYHYTYVWKRYGTEPIVTLAMGSVAHAFVHHSTVPVLVLRQDATPALSRHGAGAHTLRTLVPLDGSRLSEDALSLAAHLTAALAAPAQGALHLVQVVKPVPTTAEEGEALKLHEEARQSARAYLLHPWPRRVGALGDGQCNGARPQHDAVAYADCTATEKGLRGGTECLGHYGSARLPVSTSFSM